MITAIVVLEMDMRKYEEAKAKSIASYNRKQISLEEHEAHLKNLNPIIQSYKEAIEILENAYKNMEHGTDRTTDNRTKGRD
jgi:hypothetical protein